MTLQEKANKNISDILKDAIRYDKASSKALVIFDTRCELTRIFTQAYRAALPEGLFLNFDTVSPEYIMRSMQALTPGDLVVLVQSASFRLNEFRFRIELFQRGLKTIEQIHLQRMDEDQYEIYVDAFEYDSDYFHIYGHGLKKRVDAAEKITVECEGTSLVFGGKMESAKLNIGDYTGMSNVGGTYPIGEVFSELVDLTKLNGEAMVFGYADMNHMVQIVKPFKIIIRDGVLVEAIDAPDTFNATIELIKTTEQPFVREFGLGLSRAMSKDRVINDITAFERQVGLHLSLGMKHTVYKKEGLNSKNTRFHVDIFVDCIRMYADTHMFYDHGTFIV